MTAEEEKRYINDARKGDRDAFGKLVEENQTRVYSLALKMLKSEQDALDISQDAFIRAYTGLDRFKGESRFSVWLYRITYNLCIDTMRKKSWDRMESLSSGGDDEHPEEDIADERALPERELEKKELRDGILRGFSKLPEGQRNILLMREVTGMGYRDIAEAMEISEGTVKSRIARARKKLADILISDGTYVPDTRHKDREEAAELV